MVDSRRVTVARARPRASRSRAKPSMSARRTANKAKERVRHQVVNWRRSSAYASRVSPRYPARNPARASRSGSVKAGWMVTRAVDGAAVVIGHLRAGLRPGRLGQLRVPAIERKNQRKSPSPVTPCHSPPQTEYGPTTEEAIQTAEYGAVKDCHGARWPGRTDHQFQC